MYKRINDDNAVIEVAENLFKYQNFKGDVVCSKYKQNYYNDSSLKAMLSIMRSYLLTGKKDNKRVPPIFYATVDKCLANHVQPLKASEADAARAFRNKPQKSKVVKKTVKTSTPVYEKKVLKNFENYKKQTYKLALQVEDMIKICPDESYMNGYMDAFKQMEKQLGQTLNFKQVKISILD